MRGGESHDPPSLFCRPFAMYEWIHPGVPHHTWTHILLHAPNIWLPARWRPKYHHPFVKPHTRTSSNKLQDLSSESQSRPSRVVWIDDEVISGQVGLPCSALFLFELLGWTIFFVNIKWWRILLSFGLRHELQLHFITFSHIISSLTLFFYSSSKAVSQNWAFVGLDHQKVCNFLWILCTFEYTSKKLIHSSILSHNCSLLLLHNTTSHYILDLGNKQGKKLSESLQ